MAGSPGLAGHGDTIERAISPAAGNVHALLAYLERRRFAVAPRLRATTADGTREILGYVPGDSGYLPLAAELLRDESLVAAARVVRGRSRRPQHLTGGDHRCSASPSSATAEPERPSWPTSSAHCWASR